MTVIDLSATSRFAYELGCIGGGNMAEGIIAAVVARKLYPPERIIVSEPLAERRQVFASLGLAVTGNNRELMGQSRRVLLAIKPQAFGEVMAPLAKLLSTEQVLISILAGFSTEKLAAAFPGSRPRVIRAMPNLPIRVGAGITGLCAGRFANEQDMTDARAIFDAGGSSVVVDDESLMDAITAVSGSGPAYFYYFVEAMVTGGMACGLSEADALKLAEHTCLGAARMMLETGELPAELRKKVTSKGGTTQAALEQMNDNAVAKGIRDAVRAAFNRARELGS